ncbi:MAG: arginine--tRNA ligase [Clostridia bacterium]
MINIKQQLASLVTGYPVEEVEGLLSDIEDNSLGDYALPCFKFAKQQRLSPNIIAQQIASSIQPNVLIDKVCSVGGYCNFYLNKQYVTTQIVSQVVCQSDYGNSSLGQGKTICIDYSSINIAKPFHIGHLGTTAIGSCLYKVYKALGYNVVGINHLGDWGTQFGKLIVAYNKWSDKETILKGGLRALQDIYVRFHVEAEKDDSLNDQAREWFARIEQGDKSANELFNFFKDITLCEVKKLYQRLNVTFDSWNGESFYNNLMPDAIKFLEEKNIVTTSDGARVVDLSAYNMPPCLLVKSDGASLYATRDITAIMYRKATYDFYKCLYVVAYQQNLHFKQVFKVIELAGLPYADSLVHVAYGMVSLEEGSMSTRKGNTVWLEDVLNRAVDKARSIIEDKNPELPNKAEIAEQVGVGAVIFSALCNSRIKDITFSFDRVLSFEGETAPYLQYTHARCCSIFEKAGMSYYARCAHDHSVYDNVESVELAKLINKFPQVLVEVGQRYEPSILSCYLIDLAKSFNKYYLSQKMLCEDLGKQNARLDLAKSVQITLNKGLTLLGIACPTKM